MLDWDDLRFFLAVARLGTMSEAARALEVTQPTVGRRVSAFEKRLGARLFQRDGARWSLSDVGRGILAHAERMEQDALAAESAAKGRDEGVTGQVRITGSEWLIASVLALRVGPLLARNPALALELSADARHLSLVRREADLAIRPSRFVHQEVFQRELAVVEFALYASGAYLARHGEPDFARGSDGHVLIAMTEEMRTIVDVDWLPPLVGRARVAARANGREPMAAMAAAGVGIACLPRVLGDATAGLRLLSTPGARPRRKLWLGVHRASRSVPRIRATIAFLVKTFDELRSALAPSE